MITPRAKAGLSQILPRCLEEPLRTETHSAWQVQPIGDTKEIKSQYFILLTLSSYDFRFMVLLHFSTDQAAMKYVADSLKIAPGELQQNQYYDFLSEVGNIFCGAIKREMYRFYPHLGMSTPNRLVHASLAHVKSWPVDHEAHVKAQTPEGAEFYGSLYVSSFGELDFDLTQQPKQEEAMNTGALELF